MINLLTKYCVRERWEPLVKVDDGGLILVNDNYVGFLALPSVSLDPLSEKIRELEPKILNITRNVIAFCRISMERDSKKPDSDTRSFCRVLFTPSVKEYEALARGTLFLYSHDIVKRH